MSRENGVWSIEATGGKIFGSAGCGVLVIDAVDKRSCRGVTVALTLDQARQLRAEIEDDIRAMENDLVMSMVEGLNAER